MVDEKIETAAEENAAEEKEAVKNTAESGASAEEKTEKKKNKKNDAKIAELEAKLEEADKALAEQNDKYMRMAAEYDNFRKRSAHDRELTRVEAIEAALKNILPVGDNLARASQFTDPASVAKGVEMMQKSFTEALAKMGIEEIDAKGQPFDPELHNAVMHVEDETLGESVVADVLQKGYKMGDRVLRYAMVTVAN